MNAWKDLGSILDGIPNVQRYCWEQALRKNTIIITVSMGPHRAKLSWAVAQSFANGKLVFPAWQRWI